MSVNSDDANIVNNNRLLRGYLKLVRLVYYWINATNNDQQLNLVFKYWNEMVELTIGMINVRFRP